MFNRGKFIGSPSIPRKLKQKIKAKHQVPIAVRKFTDTSDEWTDVHKASDQGSTQDWSDVDECTEEVSDFTSEDDYSPVEQLRCEEFTSFDYITDQIVIPSSKSLLDSDDFDYFKNGHPVACSTQLFPEATLFEDEINESVYFKRGKPVKEVTCSLPEAPNITDDVDYFQLKNPKASSTLRFPEPPLAEEEIVMMGQLKPLIGCRSVDLSSIATAPSSPCVTSFERDISPLKNDNYPDDKDSNYIMDTIIAPLSQLSLKTPKMATELEVGSIPKLSVRASKEKCSISNVRSRSLRNGKVYVTEDFAELTRKPLTGSRSVDLSSIAKSASLTSFESDIGTQNNDNYPDDIDSNYSMDSIIVPLSNVSLNTPKISSESEDFSIPQLSAPSSKKECNISNVGSQSVIGSVVQDLPDKIGSRTNSFFNSLKKSKQKLSNIQRKSAITNSNLDYTKFRRLKDISNQDLISPTRRSISARNNLVRHETQSILQGVPICCLSNKQGIQRPLKVMTPFYRSDVPIDLRLLSAIGNFVASNYNLYYN